MLIEKLTQEEARALGTLLEKSLATPDYYPMTLNALRTACNQKSSRDPVTDFEEETLAIALAGLKRKCLVTFIPYGSQGNQYKYRHFLEDIRFNLSKADLAVLAVLLLRGAHTLNEVKLRASSLHPLATLEAAEAVLKALSTREEPLAELLAKRPGWKEVRWRDMVRDPLEDSSADYPAAGAGSDEAGPEVGPRASKPTAAESELEILRRELEELKASHADLRRTVEALKADLYGSKT